MKFKEAKIIGFSLSDGGEQTVLVKVAVKSSLTEKERKTKEKNYSKVSIKLFEDEDLKRLQKIDRELGQKVKKKKKTIKGTMIKFGRLLMA